jgi:SpoVK/Ycf46/Vps4 family AAA+-type ATPase
MDFMKQVNDLTEQIQRVCGPQARYRVLWVVGPPRTGKSVLCQAVSRRDGWQYVNFALDLGYLDGLIGREETYRPEDFMTALRAWCAACPAEVLILDEIEALLGLWSYQQQDTFFRLIGRAARLERGVVIATRLRSPQEMAKLMPGPAHVFELGGGRR